MGRPKPRLPGCWSCDRVRQCHHHGRAGRIGGIVRGRDVNGGRAGRQCKDGRSGDGEGRNRPAEGLSVHHSSLSRIILSVARDSVGPCLKNS